MKFVHDDYADEDLIGHRFARDALINLVLSASDEARSSFTVGVYGEWGSGKTTMLRQLEAKLGVEDQFVTCWFNPWQFSADSNIIRAFFEVLAKALQDQIDIGQKADGKKMLDDAVLRVKKASNALWSAP